MSNFKVSDADKEKLGSLALVIRTDRDFSVDDAFINKGNKQAAKRARVASLKAGKAAKQYRAESMSTHAANSLRIDIILIYR
jgi:predicted transcriptional regulator